MLTHSLSASLLVDSTAEAKREVGGAVKSLLFVQKEERRNGERSILTEQRLLHSRRAKRN